MCGIAGYYRPEGVAGPTPEALERAVAALRHRGPDAEGFWYSEDGRVGLGHARLSVIDPEGGAQPMVDPDTGVVVCANGEIYNFRELFAQFEAEGRRPRTRSDTEALLLSVSKWRRQAPSRLRGMFAFAAWDSREDRLLLARDRFGQKPLYHAPLGNGGLAFASEPGALFRLLDRRPDPDMEALSLYLSFGYVPAPRTAFSGVRKLPAAHLLIAGRETPERYWSRPAPEAPPRDRTAAAEELRARIRDSVRLRLVSDVPLGAFLSGGLDSATVVAFMAREAAGPVRTFTVKTPYADYDESAIARQVAERYGTDHTEIEIAPPDVEEIPDLLGRWGEPFGDSSALATALVSRAAREHVTVALTGDGGDEVFGGYDRFRILGLLSRLARPARLLGLLPGRRTRRISELSRMDGPGRYLEYYESFNRGLRSRLLEPDFLERWGDSPERFLRDLYLSHPGEDMDRMLATDAATWLPDDLNVKVDIASMAVSLECRSPLQDHLLAETAARIPGRLHVRGRTTKALLRRAVGDLLPTDVLEGKKRGFAAPVEHWFRGDLRGFLESRLTGPALASLGVVRRSGVREVLDRFDAGGPGHPRIQVWILLALALWAEAVQ